MISLTLADSQKGLKFRNRCFSSEALDYMEYFLSVIQDQQRYILENFSDLLVCNKSLSVIYVILFFHTVGFRVFEIGFNCDDDDDDDDDDYDDC